MEEMYTPMGMVYNQYGKDLSRVRYVIGTGGVLIHNADPYQILKAVEYTTKKPLELRPVNPKYLLDADYILAAMGLLSQIDPMMALKIMKKHMAPVQKDENADEKQGLPELELHKVNSGCGCGC